MAAAQHIWCVRTVGSLKGRNIYGTLSDKNFIPFRRVVKVKTSTKLNIYNYDNVFPFNK